MVDTSEQSQNSQNDTEWDKKPLLTRDHFHQEFSTEAYLEDFYTKVEDSAMQFVLRFLPGIAARLPEQESILDFGAGPTIHVAVCFRNRTERIYLADYLPQNRNYLQSWLNGRSTFDWTQPLRMIATAEGVGWDKLEQMEQTARSKIGGIFFCNCLEDPALSVSDKTLGLFGVVISIFTIEYCCNTTEEYRNAIRRVVELIRPGGYFVLCGILEETWCSFGGRKFTCCHITRDVMLDSLREAGLVIDFEDKQRTIMFEINGMFMIAAQRATIE